MAGMFGGSQPALPATTPVQAAPEPTPVVDDATVARKKKEALIRQQQRGGRDSTILSDAGSDTLG